MACPDGNAVQANSNVITTVFDSATIGGNLNVSVATATTFIGNLTGEVNGAAFDTNAGAVVGIIAITVSVATLQLHRVLLVH